MPCPCTASFDVACPRRSQIGQIVGKTRKSGADAKVKGTRLEEAIVDKDEGEISRLRVRRQETWHEINKLVLERYDLITKFSSISL